MKGLGPGDGTVDPNANPGDASKPALPNTGWVIGEDGEEKTEAEAAVTEKRLDEDELKTIGNAAFVGAEDVDDAPKENPADWDVFVDAPKENPVDGDVLVGAEDAPNENPVDGGAFVGAEDVDAAPKENGDAFVGAEDVDDAPKENGDAFVVAVDADDAPKENPVDGDAFAAADVVDSAPNENPVDGDAFVAADAVDDAPKENPVVEEPKIGDFGLCQLEPRALPEGAALELAELEEAAEEFPPKLNAPEVPLLKELAVLITEVETKLPEELNIGRVAPLLDPTALPKLNMPGVAPLLELTAVASETAGELTPNLTTLGVETPAVITSLVSDEEADELKPKVLLGLNTWELDNEELKEVLPFAVNDEEPSPRVLLPKFAAANAETVENELLELPELGSPSALVLRSATSEMLEVDAAEAALDVSTAAPNFKIGAVELECFVANPKMLPVVAAEVLVAVWTLEVEENRRAPAVDGCFVSLEEAALSDTGGELKTDSAFSLYSEGKEGNLSATLELKLNKGGGLFDSFGLSNGETDRGRTADIEAAVVSSDAGKSIALLSSPIVVALPPGLLSSLVFLKTRLEGILEKDSEGPKSEADLRVP
ncbi:hypothetical protein CDL12_12022 [Handroanthus impetiginosus]|uniref:Uncharacterized protein n=1 Tax=Handroanthus impetiginosus TaxID=429701 RepID=A0A2G9HCS5_9LAMI|nr:hypothetical protein CDL12_12022 [Handroanthus impetiginosus]